MTSNQRESLLALFMMAFLAAGCGDDDGTTGETDAAMDLPGDSALPTDAADTDGGGMEPAPLYAICGATFTMDGRVGYMALVDDLGSDTTVDLADTLSIPGGFLCASDGTSGRIYLATAEELRIQRYSVSETGDLEFDLEFALMPAGITAARPARNPMHFLSPTKAYYIDGSTEQIVVWNPETMTISGTISIDGIGREGFTFGLNFVDRVGDRLIVSARYFREDGSADIFSRAAIIDTTDDSVTYAEDDRCGNLAWSTVASNGDIYFASHPVQASRVRIGQAGDPAGDPCMLRLLEGASDFDADFYVEVNELTGGRPTGALIPGSGDTAYMLAYDEELVPITDENRDRLNVTPGWTYWATTLAADISSATEVTSVPAGAAYGLGGRVNTPEGEVPVIISVAQDLTSGTLFDVSNPDGFQELVTSPGFPLAVLRVR